MSRKRRALKIALVFIAIIIFMAWLSKSEPEEERESSKITLRSFKEAEFKQVLHYRSIPCQINGQVIQNVDLAPSEKAQWIKCILNGTSDVFVPFTFVKKYFDIYGELKGSHFEWSHTYSKVIGENAL